MSKKQRVVGFLYPWLFNSDDLYTAESIAEKAEIVVCEDTLRADTPEREYVFKQSGDKWKLDHTWGHFIIGKKS